MALATKVPPQARRLSFFTGDYNFLMERLPDKTSGAHNVGPENQRQGAWARLLPSGESIRLKAQDRFATSLKAGKVLVTYLDQAKKPGASLEISAGKLHTTVALKNTGRWQTVVCKLPVGPLSAEAGGGNIKLTAGAGPVYLHMVEVER